MSTVQVQLYIRSPNKLCGDLTPYLTYDAHVYEESFRAESFCTQYVLKVEKLHNSFTFMLIAFFVETFLQPFQRIRSVFDTHIELFENKIWESC
jgi:hypothetical protein